MRLLIQRVTQAKVEVSHKIVGEIGHGLLALLGMHITDDASVIPYLVEKLIHLRIFSDGQDKMNRSLVDVQGGVLVVSQFTLYGECTSGRRPSFITSAKPDSALKLYRLFVHALQEALKSTPCQIQTGEFGASMQITLINDGPVTFLLEKKTV